MENKKALKMLLVIVMVHFLLTVYGIWWGLPDRWNTDEHVAKALRFITSGSPFTVVDTAHPQAYDILLGIWMLPYLAVLKIIGYPLAIAKSAAAISWIELAHRCPGFATGAYVWGRLSSVALNILTIVFVYRTALLVYKKRRAALISAAVAALSAGLIEIGHFTKCSSLVTMLIMAAGYYALRSISEDFEKNFYKASILAGAAVSSQADGAFSVIYLGCAGLIYAKKNGLSARTVGTFAAAAFIMAVTFIVLWPALIGNRQAYLVKEIAGFSMTGIPALPVIAEKVFENIKFTAYIFSPILAIFAWGGLLYNIWNWRRFSPYTQIFSSVLAPYLFMAIIYFVAFPGAYTKFLIHAIPIMSIWAGVFINDILDARSLKRGVKTVFMIIIFSSAVLYDIKAVSVFAFKDTRYVVGKWIESNIKKGSSIEHFQEMDILFPSKVVRDYNVVFFGKNSSDHAGRKFYDIIYSATRDSYMERIDREGLSSDHIFIASGKDFLLPSSLEPAERRNSVIYRLLEGRQPGYCLVRVFDAPESVFTDPKPSYTSPTISVYKRTER